jgi:hypothetical protein
MFSMCTKTLHAIDISVKAYMEDPATIAFASSCGGDCTVAWTEIKQDPLVEVWQDQRVIKEFLEGKRNNFNLIRGYHVREAERRWKLHKCRKQLFFDLICLVHSGVNCTLITGGESSMMMMGLGKLS